MTTRSYVGDTVNTHAAPMTQGQPPSEELTKTKQEFSLHIEMLTVNGLFAVGGGRVR